MKFTKVEINNFYNLKNVNLDLSNGIALIVGPNGSGKSNIIKCIDFLVQYIRGETDKDVKIWDNNQPEWHIKVDAVLTKDEVQLVSNLRVCYLLFMTGIIAVQIQWPHSGQINLRAAPEMSGLIEQVNNELLPKLIEITEERPGNGSRVSMRVHQGAGSGELNYSYDIRMHLPSEQQMKKERECILATFQSLFDDSTFAVLDHSGYHTKISDLVANEKWHLIDEVTLDGVHYNSSSGPFSILRKSLAFSSWMHNFPSTTGELLSIAEKVFFDARALSSSLGKEIVKHLLENSLCILPQSRELETKNKFSLDVKKAERMLIQASISENNQKDRFTSVTKALKSFCGLDIYVREKKFDFRHTNKNTESDVKDFVYALEHRKERQIQWRGIPIDAEESLLNIAKEVGEQKKKEPSWTGSLQVLVTRTMPTNGPPYSITTPLSGLSGGEIELLMTLCAVHLSGADTVFLDEPGHSFHPPMQAQLRRWLVTHRPRDQTCVVVSHSTEFVSPESLSCLYHMSFVGRGFTPFRLRLVGHDASLTDVTTSDKKEESASVKEVKTPDPSGDRNVPDKDTESVSSEENEQTTGLSGNITASDNSEQELTSPRKEEHNSPSSSDGSAFKKYQESACEKKVQASESEVTFTQESITMLMRPDMRKMFFATGLYFVEGESDKRVLSAVRDIFMKEASDIMEKSKDPKKIRQAMKVEELDQWDILTLGGCGDAVKAYKAATELQIPCAFVLDIDAITVKHGRQVQPFNKANWKKSKLFKGLRGKTEKEKKDKDSLPFAQTLLTEVENAFQEAGNSGNALQNARDALKTQGFFIWEGDLESVICDTPTMRVKLLEMKNFLKVVGEYRNCSSFHGSRNSMSVKEAQDNYDDKVLAKLLPLAQGLVDELEGTRERIAETTTEPVTGKALELINQINKNKQVLTNHDMFVTRGTKGKESIKDPATGKQGTSAMKSETAAVAESNSLNSSSDEPDPTKQVTSGKVERSSSQSKAQTSSSSEQMPQQRVTSAENEAPTNRNRFRTEEQETLFWNLIKRKLHDEGGWTKMPLETLTEVVRVCLQSEPSPLADLCRFMKQIQRKGKKRKREFSQDLLSRILNLTDDDDMDD